MYLSYPLLKKSKPSVHGVAFRGLCYGIQCIRPTRPCKAPSSPLESKIRQRIDRPIDIQQRGIGVKIRRQLDSAVPHGGLGDAGITDA
jgi:hypothetical protein